MKTGLPGSRIVNGFERTLREIRDTSPRKEMAGIVPSSWLQWEWGLGTQKGASPRSPKISMLAAHDARTTNPCRAHQRQLIWKLVNRSRQLRRSRGCSEPAAPKTESSSEPYNPPGGQETREILAKVRHRSPSGTGAASCLRARPTDSLRVLPASEFVGCSRTDIKSGMQAYLSRLV